MTLPEWIDRMRDVAVMQAARALGCDVGERSSQWHISPCPACGAETRHTKRKGEKRGAVGVGFDNPHGWKCYQCEETGDTLHFVALKIVGRKFGQLDAHQTREVRDWCERFLGLDGKPPVYQADEAPAATGPSYPDDLDAFFALCVPLTDDDATVAYLEERKIDPALVLAKDLAVVLPKGVDAPPWAAFPAKEDKPAKAWNRVNYRLILTLYDADGLPRNVIARTLNKRANIKGVSATEHSRSGLVMADALGRRILETGQAPAELGERPRLVIAEGEIDFLCWATEPFRGERFAVWGIVSGAFSEAHAARIPDGTVVVIATDKDKQGDQYAAKITKLLQGRIEAKEIAIERWSPSTGSDAADVRAAGADLAPLGDPLNPEDIPNAFDVAFEAGTPLRQIPAFRSAPVPETLVIPFGYRVAPSGALWRERSGNRVEYMVSTRIPLLRRILMDPATKEERLEVVFQRRGIWRSAIIERSIISVGGRDTAKALGAVGAPIEPRSAKDVAQWVASLEAHNERTLPYAQVTSQSGWHELEAGDWSFVLGGVALGKDGQESDAIIFDDRTDAAGVSRHVRTGGDAKAHKTVVLEAMAASDLIACAVYAALAAPLLVRVGAPCFAYHFVGPSSRGKTTGLGVAAGLYGSPEVRGGQGWVASWDSTSVGLEHRAVLSCDLPLCLDEAGLVPADQRERDVYMLVAGQGRTRGAARGGLRQMSSWRTNIISTGEEPLVRRERAHAGAQVRAIQVRVDGIGELTGSQVSDLGARSRQHFGWIGRAWIARLVRLTDFERLRLRYRALEKHFRQTLAERSSLEQRQAEAFAAMALAEELAHPWLGLPAPGAVERLAANTEDRVGIIPEWQRGLTVISELLASEPGAFPDLEISSTGGKRVRLPDGRKAANRYLGFYDENPQIEGHEHVLCLIGAPIRDRLEEHGLSLDTIAREWKREGVLVPESTAKARLQRRVRIDGVRQPYYVLDITAMERALGNEVGSPDPDGDPSGGPEGSQPKSPKGQMNLDTGITGITGITPNDAHVRAHAQAHAGAQARACRGSEERVIPVIPDREEDKENVMISAGKAGITGWDHSESGVIPHSGDRRNDTVSAERRSDPTPVGRASDVVTTSRLGSGAVDFQDDW